jgi:uncharacterized protein (DUF924 family)
MIAPQDILDFWFSDDMRSRWFASTPDIDVAIKHRFEPVWESALRGELDHWQGTPDGVLALILVLDQFPRNMFRGKAQAFAGGDRSLAVARQAIARGDDHLLGRDRVAFLYLPFMHSEALADQDLSVQLFEAAALAANLRFANHHRDIVRRFGRFPHRNAALGRASTAEELAYLASREAFKG